MIAQARAKLSSEELEKVSSLFSDIVRAGSELIADRSSANESDKSRKVKIRELEAIIETNKTELETFKKDITERDTKIVDLEKVKTQWDTAKTDREAANKAKWESILPKFDVKKTDKEYESIQKIKKYYALDKDLTPDQIDSNLKLATQHEELGHFSIESKPLPKTPGGNDNENDKKTTIVLNPFGS